MQETWLRPNRRALWLGTVPPLAVATLGAWVTFGLGGPNGGWTRWLGWPLLALGLTIAAVILYQIRRPRLAYRPGQLLLFVRSGGPIAVPIQLVEGFLVTRGPTGLPLASRRQKTINLVVRLAQRETDWAARSVNPSLASWQEGYVTLHGTWCEPLSESLVHRLNERLHEVTERLDTGDGTPP